MSHCHKFDPKEKDKLKNPERLQRENPDLIWKTLALENPKNFIDIGCGVGFSAIPFSKKMP
ncbi:MAG: SAM-dependent methyltransferase, partial [Nitrospinota bacterium]